MMKKIAVLAGAGALLLGLAGSALAWGPMWGDLNVANVDNATVAIAGTGGNSVGNLAVVERAGVSGEVEVEGDNNVNMTTGGADALAVGVVVANTQIGCSTCGRRGPSSTRNIASVDNATVADADTGTNNVGGAASVKMAHIGGEVEVEGNNNVNLTTSEASAKSIGVVVVNTRWTGWAF